MKPLRTLLSGALALGLWAGNLAAQQPVQLPADGGPLLVQPPAVTLPPVQPPAVALPPVFPPDRPEQRSGFVAGGSLYYLKPYFQNNTAFVTTIDPGTPFSQVISQNFQWDFKPTFAGWVGWTTSCGLGVRARYFQFDENSNTASLTNTTTPPPQIQTTINAPGGFLPLSTGGTAFGSPGTVLNTGIGTDVLTFRSDLKIQTIDLEATYAWQISQWSFLAFGGGRYLTLDQNYHATLANSGGGMPLSEQQFLNAARRFQGGGPELGLQGNVEIGRTGFSLFASGRASLLVGTVRENVNFTQTVNDPTGLTKVGSIEITPTSTRNSDHVLTTAEVELGVEYGINIGRSRLFFRAAAVNQTYFDAGNSFQSTGNLGLFGVQGSIGFNY